MEIDDKTLKELKKVMNEINKTGFFSDEAVTTIYTLLEHFLYLSKRSHETEKAFILQAKNDLKSTELLYYNGLYSNSTYNLQQTTEKIAKAWCLFVGFIDEKDLTDISHKTPRAFLKALKSKMGVITIQLIKSSKSDFTVEINILEETINKKSDEISRLKYQDIKSMFEAVNNIEYILSNEFYKHTNTISKNSIKEIVNIMMAFSWIYVISIITFPHEEPTRYPNTKGRKNALTPSDYTQELGIVKATPEILPYLEQSIKTLSGLLESTV